MYYYHGTTRAGADAILAGQEEPDSSTWIVSDPEKLYLWSADRILAHGEADTREDAEQVAIRLAFESAQISAALSGICQELIVLRLSIDEDITEHDDSCQNMELACSIPQERVREHIVSTLTCPHNPKLDVFVLAGLVAGTCPNDYLNTSNLDSDMREACRVVAESEVYLDSLMEFEWVEEHNQEEEE